MLKRALKLSGSHNLNQILSAGGTSKKTTTICSNMNQYQNIQTLNTAPTAEKWDLYSSVCVERHPIVVQPMHELELRFHKMLKRIEFENSLKSDFELKVEKEEEQKALDNINNKNDDDETVSVQTAQDLEDSYQEELNNFKFAPRITEFDKQNVTSSLKRKLDKNLLLLTHQKIGNRYFWIPPQGIRLEGETMRQTAERVLQDECGAEIKVKFYGNAPIGFNKYKYPQELRKEGICGAKIFYFLAKYTEGNIADNIKHQWLDHDELEKILPNEVQKSISQFMLDI